MAAETLSKQRSVSFEGGRWVYRHGFTICANGTQQTPHEKLSQLIPQLHALQTVVADGEWPWNDEIWQQLMYLAEHLAREAHELWVEMFAEEQNLKITARATQ